MAPVAPQYRTEHGERDQKAQNAWNSYCLALHRKKYADILSEVVASNTAAICGYSNVNFFN